ncbi:MAG: sigma-70 family RNA polymerase sigma factor, partial [Planctomycetes bacterium]|nr:sigma-70 family RNA polymerase sigma factor [Planctomycetota bacterium]
MPELPHALSFARRLGCSAADAEDALQDALARLSAVRDDAPTSLGVRAWLCREVHQSARTRLRSERRRRTREVATAVPPGAHRVDSATAIRDEVEFALSGLDDDERVAVQLRYLHDLDYKDIANVLGASEGACRQRVHKALARLRVRLGGDAAALVAALPLPVIRDASAIVKGAIAKATAVSAASGGVVVMATTTQKIAIVAIAAAALGVGGTLTVQHAVGTPDPALPVTNVVEPTREGRTRTRVAGRADDAVPASEVEALKARITELELSLAGTREKADDLDAMDPMAVLVYSRKPIAWKAKRLLEIADERQRWAAMGKVAQVLAEKESSGREFLDALKSETDPKVIGML